jgi:cell division protein FtsQ
MTWPGGSYRDGERSGSDTVGDSAISARPTVFSARSADAGATSADGSARSADAGATSADSPARRRSRSRRSWRAAFFALALAGIVAGAAWALLGPRLLVVRSIVVTGTHLVPASTVLAVSGIQPGTPLIRVNTARAAARVKTIRQVASARVTRSWPDRVVIAVRERTPAVAVTAPGGGFDLVDGDGVIVQWAARRPAGLPLYVTTEAVTSLPGDPDLGAAAAVLGGLPGKLRASVTSVTAPSPDQVTLRLAGGVTVLWGGADHAQAKAEELALLMPSHASYYDVSAQGTAVTN